MGVNCLYLNSSGDYNVAIGYQSGKNCGIAVSNSVMVGYNAGAYSTGDNNTFIGHQSGYTGAGYTGSNVTCLGSNSVPSSTIASNEITLGDNAITAVRCATGVVTTLSDSRDKANIEQLPLGLEFINQIQPSRFKWDRRDNYESGISNGSKKADNWTVGFIAQQLDEVQTTNNAEYLNLVYKSNPDKWEATAGNLLPVLVKAIQDLSKENLELKTRLTNLEEKVNSL